MLFNNKNNYDGFIVAAGNQSRFDDELPKALIKIDGNSLLSWNIQIMKKYVKNIFIIISKDKLKYFLQDITENYKFYKKIKSINLCPIESGFGCGDAIYKILNKSNNKNIIMIWGDSIQLNENIYKKSIKNFKSNGLDIEIPVCLRENPYVKFDINSNQIEFSNKENGIEFKNGYQDLSFFIFNKEKIDQKLNSYYIHYVKDKNIEFKFLDIFNKFPEIKLSKTIFDNIPKNSFNTKEELEDILKEI